jgi:sulfur-carrier protein
VGARGAASYNAGVMPITVKFFASLRERVGRGEATLEPRAALTAREVWTRAAGAQAMPSNTLVAINMEYAGVDQPVKDGDEVAFFPPVTGG